MEGSVARADRVKRLQQLIDQHAYVVTIQDVENFIFWGAAKCLAMINKRCLGVFAQWMRSSNCTFYIIAGRVFILEILLANGLRNWRPHLLKDLWDYYGYCPVVLAMSACLIDWGYPPIPLTRQNTIPTGHSTTTIDYNNRIAAFKLRKTSCVVLLRILWSKGMPKDVARLIARDPVLWNKSAWREWPCN